MGYKKIIFFLHVLAILTIPGCTNRANIDIVKDTLPAVDFIDDILRGQQGFIEVAQNENFILYIKGATAEIMARHKHTGYTWYSNPQGREEDVLASPENKNWMASQVDLSYYDERQVYTRRNSFTDAVEHGQFSFASIDNGVRVTYVIGRQLKTYLVPEAITVERFEELILNNLPETEREYVYRRYSYTVLDEILNNELRSTALGLYPALAERPLYILTENLPGFVMDRLNEYIMSTGYTEDDLLTDAMEINAEPPSQPISFVVPLEYRLDGDSLVVTLRNEYVEVRGSAYISEISLLRYFGAAGSESEGYMLLPDGSGSLIYLNNDKHRLAPLKIPVYGADLIKSFDEMPPSSMHVSLPVYGIKQDSQAFLAVIESGDPIASIEANVRGHVNGYNHIYPTFEINQMINIPVPYFRTNDMIMFQEKPFSKDLQIRYFFLTADKADYAGMARRYQSYLLDIGTLKLANNQTPSIYLDIMGLATYRDTFFGLPIEKKQTLTTFTQAMDIVNMLHENGVGPIIINYSSWANGGYINTPMDKINPEKSLGGAKGIRELHESLNTLGGELFLSIGLQYVYENKLFDSYIGLVHSPRSILNQRTGKKTYFTGTLTQSGTLSTITPRRFGLLALRSQNSMKRNGFDDIGINLGEMSRDLYSDFNRQNTVDRQDALYYSLGAFNVFTDNGHPLLVESPNVYALSGASHAIRVPVSSTGYYLTDRSVPFYQIVLHGIIPYAGDALNYAGDYEEMLLRSVETGSCILFRWIYEPNHVLTKTFASYHSMWYGAWFDKALESYRGVYDALRMVSGSPIAGHAVLTNDVVKTWFECGVVFYVNYGNIDAVVEGVEIGARSFEIINARDMQGGGA